MPKEKWIVWKAFAQSHAATAADLTLDTFNSRKTITWKFIHIIPPPRIFPKKKPAVAGSQTAEIGNAERKGTTESLIELNWTKCDTQKPPGTHPGRLPSNGTRLYRRPNGRYREARRPYLSYREDSHSSTNQTRETKQTNGGGEDRTQGLYRHFRSANTHPPTLSSLLDGAAQDPSLPSPLSLPPSLSLDSPLCWIVFQNPQRRGYITELPPGGSFLFPTHIKFNLI